MRLAPDDEDALGLFCHLEQVLALQQSPINSLAFAFGLTEIVRQLRFPNLHPEQRAHGGLHHLGIPQFHTIHAAHHIADAKPLGRADERAHVAWVGDAVQGKDKPRRSLDFALSRNPHHSKDAWWRVLPAHLLHLHLGSHFGLGESRIISEESLGGIKPDRVEIGMEQLFHHLAPFHDEEPQFLAELLLPQRGDLLNGVLGNHGPKVQKKAVPRVRRPKYI